MSPLLGPFSVARRSARKETSSSLLLRHLSKKGSVSEQLYSRRDFITMNLYARLSSLPLHCGQRSLWCARAQKREECWLKLKSCTLLRRTCWIADVLIVILTWVMIHCVFVNRLVMFGSQLADLFIYFFLILKNESINQTETNYWAKRKTHSVCAVQLDYCSSNICMSTWH